MSGVSGLVDPDSEEHTAIVLAAVGLRMVLKTVCGSNTSYFVSAFADLVGRGSVGVPEDVFEADLQGLLEGIRMNRALEQSEKAVKS